MHVCSVFFVVDHSSVESHRPTERESSEGWAFFQVTIWWLDVLGHIIGLIGFDFHRAIGHSYTGLLDITRARCSNCGCV